MKHEIEMTFMEWDQLRWLCKARLSDLSFQQYLNRSSMRLSKECDLPIGTPTFPTVEADRKKYRSLLRRVWNLQKQELNEIRLKYE